MPRGMQPVASTPIDGQFVRLYRNETQWPRLHFAKAAKAVTGSLDQVNELLKWDEDD